MRARAPHTRARAGSPTRPSPRARAQLSKRKRMEKIEPLYNHYEEKDAWCLSKRRG